MGECRHGARRAIPLGVRECAPGGEIGSDRGCDPRSDRANVAEAAVIAVPDEKWAERPLAAIVLKPGAGATAEELRDYLAPKFAKFWLPDRFEFVDEIPKTSVGKFRKTALREQFTGSTSAVVQG